ncbi:MAG: hypothetical protein AAF489_17155, partial [Bacteroidota bacterium]
MKFFKLFFIAAFFLNAFSINAQVCDELIPICTSQDGLDNNAIDPVTFTITTTCQNLQGTRTAWYLILIDQPTNFTFQIEPTLDIDYDFAVYVNADCANLGVADRGSFDAPGPGEYDTGLNLTATDTCETAAGDGQVSFIPLVPGDEVIIVVDRFSNTADTFDLTFGDPEAFDCSIVLTEACEGDVVTLDAGTLGAQAYTWSFENPIGSGNFDPFVPAETNSTLQVTQSGNYRVEIELFGGAINTEFYEVIFYPQPVFEAPLMDLFICDDGGTPGIFDLTVNGNAALGGQDPALFNVLYFDGVGAPIPFPAVHLITGANETITLRIEDLTGTCFIEGTFEITFAAAIAGVVPDFSLCDVDGDGSEDINLHLNFDLTVLNGQSPSDFDITYHTSQAAADADGPDLPIPYTVTGPSETIYIRFENSGDPNCFDTSQNFTIFVNLPPVINMAPEPLVLCDDDGFGDFDLTLADADITGGDPDLTVSYHGTLLDAQNNLLPIIGLYPNDDIYNDSVWARVVSATTGCFSLVELFLVVREIPEAVTPAEPLRLCDDAVADGFTFFDLTVVRDEVLGG